MLPLLFSLFCITSANGLTKDYFTAAVFEHRPGLLNVSLGKPLEIKAESLEYYEKAAGLAAQQGADLLLFNEYGTAIYPFTREGLAKFAEHVPDPDKHKFNPCLEKATDQPVLHKSSCLAREHHMYVVVNMIDVHPCEGSCDADQIAECDLKCPEDDMYFYNTDVAFDREGNIVARYHKVHPYFEVVNVPDGPEFITFETDFGKFGMIVCFDSVFEETAILAKEHGIDTLLFPTYWFDDIVPLLAVEFQQSIAIAHGINFLAANTHTPGTGSIGSGIYTKDGAVVYTYEPNGYSKLLVANVRVKGDSKIPEINSITAITKDSIFPVVETGEHFPDHCYEPLMGKAENYFTDYRCFKLKVENYTVAKLEGPSGQVEACSNGFCCSLTYSAEEMTEDYYLAVFNGLNNVRGYFQWWEETCVLTRCDPHEGHPCVLQPFTSKTVFKSAELKGDFKSSSIFPAVSYSNVRLAPKLEWNFERSGSRASLEFHSKSYKPLLRLSLMGRHYDKDPPFIPFFKY